MWMPRTSQGSVKQLLLWPKAKVILIFTSPCDFLSTIYCMFSCDKISTNLVLHIDVQGTCKYGTRVDYILASPNSPYKFVPGSYGVVSSKGTSDHHIVKVDLTVSKTDNTEATQAQSQGTPRFMKIAHQASSKGIWKS
jgi:hypothetical protein